MGVLVHVRLSYYKIAETAHLIITHALTLTHSLTHSLTHTYLGFYILLYHSFITVSYHWRASE